MKKLSALRLDTVGSNRGDESDRIFFDHDFLIRSADRLGSPLHVIPLALPSDHALKTFDPDPRINFPHRLDALSMPSNGILKIILLPLLVVKTYLDGALFGRGALEMFGFKSNEIEIKVFRERAVHIHKILSLEQSITFELFQIFH